VLLVFAKLPCRACSAAFLTRPADLLGAGVPVLRLSLLTPCLIFASLVTILALKSTSQSLILLHLPAVIYPAGRLCWTPWIEPAFFIVAPWRAEPMFCV